jgi:phosphoribosylformimino-5-aminoimidazole carboxamide ribotide isomerase
LAAYPGGLQIGGGITAANAIEWIDAGASHVIVTSWLFDASGRLLARRLDELADAVGRDRVVLDLSCRRCQSADGVPSWRVAMNRWQTLTDVEITPGSLEALARHASEFLIHAADVEGLCQGIDADLVRCMADWGGLPMTYAGGVASMDDVRLVESASGGLVDVTVGSALDLFGGSGVRYDELLRFNRRR